MVIEKRQFILIHVAKYYGVGYRTWYKYIWQNVGKLIRY